MIRGIIYAITVLVSATAGGVAGLSLGWLGTALAIPFGLLFGTLGFLAAESTNRN